MDAPIHLNHESNYKERTDWKKIMKAVAFTLWVGAINFVNRSLSVSVCVHPVVQILFQPRTRAAWAGGTMGSTEHR